VTVDPAVTPEALDWIRTGAVEILPDEADETTLAPRSVEFAVARRRKKSVKASRRREPADERP